MGIVDYKKFSNHLFIFLGSVCLGIFFESGLFAIGLYFCLLAFIGNE